MPNFFFVFNLGHTDAVRGIAIVSAEQFLSCSNDATGKINFYLLKRFILKVKRDLILIFDKKI